MKTKIILIIISLFSLIFFTSEINSDNGRAGRTGSPGESTCTSCHSDFALNSGGGSIVINATGMPGYIYTPGQTYNMSVTVSRNTNNLFGVGIEALTGANDNAGTLNITDAVSTQIKSATVSGISRRNIVHQLNGGASSNSKVFNFSWTAPAAGTGNVTFYFAGAATNNNGSESGDYIYSGSQILTEQSCSVPSQPGAISGTANPCQGSSITYSIAAVSGATSYNWTFPSGWTGTSTSASVTVVAGSTSGTISVTANNACGSSPAQTLAVTANHITLSTTSMPVSCFGGNNGSAAVSPSGGSGPYTYAWSPSGGTAATANNLSAGNYTVLVTDANSCSSSASVSISEPTTLMATTSSLPVSCFGGSNGTAAVSVSGGTSPYTYSWSPGGGSTATISSLGSGNYSVVITDANNCQTTQNVLVSEPTILIASAGPDHSLCTGSDVTIGGTPSGNGGTAPYTFAWNPSTGLNDATIANPDAEPLNNTTYTLLITDANGCTSTDSMTVTVNPLPVVNISLQNDTLFATPGAVNYDWILNSNYIPGANQYYWVPTQNGDYQVAFWDSNGCSAVSQVFTYLSVGIASDPLSSIILIYPNPVKNFITIIHNEAIKNPQVSVIDLTGRTVLTKETYQNNSAIDISGIAEGLYYIVLNTTDSKIIKEFVKGNW